MFNHFFIRVAVGLAAGIALFLALGSAGFAIFISLAGKLGQIQAALALSAIYLALAGLLGFVASKRMRMTAVQSPAVQRIDEQLPALSWVSAIARERPLVAFGVAAGLGVVKALSHKRT